MKYAKLFSTIAVAALIGLGAGMPAKAQDEKKSTHALVMERLGELGLTRCVDRIDSVLDFLASKGDSDILVYFDEQQSNDNLVSFLIARSTENQNYLATLDFSQTDTCSSTYTITRVWASACAEVLEKEYPNYGNPKPLHAGFELRMANQNLHVAARQISESQCLTVQKEVIY